MAVQNKQRYGQAYCALRVSARQKDRPPKGFLKDFSDHLHTNGYKSYLTLPVSIKGMSCWAHARRYFDEALKVLSATQQNSSQVYNIWTYCNQMFAIKYKLKKCSPEERYGQRQKKAKPILDAFLRWA